jgi:hypothetical protein
MSKAPFKLKSGNTTPFKQMGSSPARETEDEDVDTSWLDQIYAVWRVNEGLRKSGHHTEGDLRGKKISKEHKYGDEPVPNTIPRMGTDNLL